MASKSQQVQTALLNKKKAESRLVKALTPWINSIAFSYRIGNTNVNQESTEMLLPVLKNFYAVTSKDVVKFDYRQYKQNEDSEFNVDDLIYIPLAISLNSLFDSRVTLALNSINQTASDWVKRTTDLAIANGYSPIEARRVLTNYLKGQRLIIAITESQWTVETTRKAVVIAVKDPLKNTVSRIVEYLLTGKQSEAVKLSREVLKLAKLPLSVAQGEVIRTIAESQTSLITPLGQGRAIASLTRRAEELDVEEKEWVTVGDENVRQSHQTANGQVREVDKPFKLENGLVQYPGDASLGASLSEIINCRCVAAYI